VWPDCLSADHNHTAPRWWYPICVPRTGQHARHRRCSASRIQPGQRHRSRTDVVRSPARTAGHQSDSARTLAYGDREHQVLGSAAFLPLRRGHMIEPGKGQRPPSRWSSRITSWALGAATPPLWLRLCCALILVPVSLRFFDGRRELMVAVANLLFYAGAGVSVLFFWQSTFGWLRIHGFADRLLIIPLMFLALAYTTTIPSVLCLVISVLPFAMLSYLGWRRRALQSH
jgi:hypothetical protein